MHVTAQYPTRKAKRETVQIIFAILPRFIGFRILHECGGLKHSSQVPLQVALPVKLQQRLSMLLSKEKVLNREMPRPEIFFGYIQNDDHLKAIE